MNYELAKFAIQAYSDRNTAFHSTIGSLRAKRDWAGLADSISQDLEDLETILPASEQCHLMKWQALLNFYWDRHLRKDQDTGAWVYRSPSDLQNSITTEEASTNVDDGPVIFQQSPKRKTDPGLCSPTKKLRLSEPDGKSPEPPGEEAKLVSEALQVINGSFKDLAHMSIGKAQKSLDRFKGDLRTSHLLLGQASKPNKADRRKARRARESSEQTEAY